MLPMVAMIYTVGTAAIRMHIQSQVSEGMRFVAIRGLQRSTALLQEIGSRRTAFWSLVGRASRFQLFLYVVLHTLHQNGK